MSQDMELILMNKDRVLRSLKRMAYEIAKRNTANSPVFLLGINDRGYVVAQILKKYLEPMFENKVRSIQFMLDKGSGEEFLVSLKKAKADTPLLIVVDDVIFSGKTMFSVLKKISDRIDPAEIHTAVLIDRGHRKFPVKAEYYGMELPTKLNEHVSVIVEGKDLERVKLVNAKE